MEEFLEYSGYLFVSKEDLTQFFPCTKTLKKLHRPSPAGQADWGAGARNDHAPTSFLDPAPQSACPAGLHRPGK